MVILGHSANRIDQRTSYSNQKCTRTYNTKKGCLLSRPLFGLFISYVSLLIVAEFIFYINFYQNFHDKNRGVYQSGYSFLPSPCKNTLFLVIFLFLSFHFHFLHFLFYAIDYVFSSTIKNSYLQTENKHPCDQIQKKFIDLDITCVKCVCIITY